MTALPLNPDVIVVGAGAAGLSAAQALREAGLVTLVLESAGHIGGRCVTDTQTFSTPFDRGGSWLHSAPINPLARIAEQKQVALHKSPWRWTKAQVNGTNLSSEEIADYQHYQDHMWQAVSDRGAVAPDVTTRAALPQGRWADLAACHIPQMLGGDGDVTSAEDNHIYADADGDWLVSGGLGAFVQNLHADVPVKHNCPVTKIDYSGAGVIVTTGVGMVQAKHLVLTVSTGVLAAEKVQFVPPLPDGKTDAVSKLPNGLLNKVGIEFTPEWKDATQGHTADYLKGDNAFCTLLFGFFGTTLATGFVAGSFADALEKEGKGAATDFCLEGLRAIYGADALKFVRRTDETAWRGNTHTFGSYSYAKPGGAGARAILAEPLADRIFFAGEATSRDAFSTVHGAYLSGKRAASEVVATRLNKS